MDERILKNVLFPCCRCDQLLHAVLAPGPDGTSCICPATFSPEYGVNAPDCTYDPR